MRAAKFEVKLWQAALRRVTRRTAADSNPIRACPGLRENFDRDVA